MKKTVVIGFLGNVLDFRSRGAKRWEKWRPSISLCMQDSLNVDRFELLHHREDNRLAHNTASDMQTISEEIDVRLHSVENENPWDFEQVYSTLLDFCMNYDFKPDQEDYLLHITTGTHVAQICWFLLCEANYIPAKLVQTSPDKEHRGPKGQYQIIDLDLSKYDAINSRFKHQHLEGTEFLKSGIATRNGKFNQMIQQIEKVAIRSTAPLLITGPTGAGKSQLAKRIYLLKQKRGLIHGEYVSVNCATLRGDGAMSALFGHTKGAFTGAQTKRQGLLARADQGLLFLDEIGELNPDEQAMLLHALEEKSFYPVGSDTPIHSDFQLIAGTNKDLHKAVAEGTFRDDLLARINLWSYQLPGLQSRREDIEPNLDYELHQMEIQHNHKVSFNKTARQKYLEFGLSSEACWQNNFRDLNASVQRMTTLADGGRINEENVNEEIDRLKNHWQTPHQQQSLVSLEDYFTQATLHDIDLFDQWQLQKVIEVCQQSKTISDAGRKLFNQSRLKKKSVNDAHRLKQYLTRFDLNFDDLIQ
ncbi:RNA repair transcriptional activator RtcR [Litoribacillus peritrichatus]|uniref:RNA repair transcriptional activator RtcR n=1 Tax=Litoribacillus peritrichatus TaxID=718191 RepID=A0ABP7NDR6_9GAMM